MKKRRVVGGKKGRVVVQNGLDGRMFFEGLG
jgi:hypothetical protein